MHRLSSRLAGRHRHLAAPRAWAGGALLAAALALAPPGAAQSGAALSAPVSVPDTIAQRVAACVACHGQEGRSAPDAYYPRIAGKPAGYLHNQLVNFQVGRRWYAPMNHLLEPLSQPYLAEIAQHFAGLDLPYPTPQPAQAAPATLERGRQLTLRGDAARDVPACIQCHGEALMGVAPAIPGLKGLPRDYINAQFGAWRNGQRHANAPDCMAQVAQRLTPDDVAAVSAWLASQPVPAGAKPEPGPAARLPLRCGGLEPRS